MTAPGSAPARARRGRRARVLRVLVWAGLVALLWYAVRVLRRVDWTGVGAALGHLSFWQVVTLALLVAARMVLSSVPLALFVDRLSLRRAVGNDLVGNLVATVTPAPADIVARMALFRAWGVDVSRGMAGLVLNSVLYYVVRLSAPLAGALVLWGWVDDEPAIGWAAITSGLVGVALIAVLVWGSRSAASAGAVGRLLGRVARRLRPGWPGPEQLERTVVEFHGNVADRWLRHWPTAFLSLVGVVAVESTLLVLSLRFVGAGRADAPTLVVIGAFLTMYLLMATPFLGLGVLDAAVVGLIVDRVPGADSALIVAGVIVWRVCVQLVPLACGAIPLLSTRTYRRRATPVPPAPPAALS